MPFKQLKIATFNLRNLVLPGVVFYDNEKYSKAAYRAKLSWIAHQLEQLDADILGFQEIFHGQALREAIARSDVYSGLDLQTNVLTAQETGSNPVVGLLTRLPVLESTVIAEFPAAACLNIQGQTVPVQKFSRPVLKARLQLERQFVPGATAFEELIVFVVHLKSKRPLLSEGADPNDPLQVAMGSARSLIVRAAEANALRHLLVETLADNRRPALVIGDINDSVHAVSSEILAGAPPFKYLGAPEKEKLYDLLLENVKDIQSRRSTADFYFTHIYNGQYESLDHIFVSNEFVSANPRHIGSVEYVKVFNDHLIDETLSGERLSSAESDHGQVVATIALRGAA
jgi:predicted extracellular nuclease